MSFREEILAEGVRLILGDCREVLPTLGKVDAVVTDPPYGINKDGQKRTTGGHGGRKAYEFLGWDAERPDPEIFSLGTALRIVGNGDQLATVCAAFDHSEISAGKRSSRTFARRSSVQIQCRIGRNVWCDSCLKPYKNMHHATT